MAAATGSVIGALLFVALNEPPGPAALDLSLGEAQARAAIHAPQVRLAAGRIRAAQATRVGAGLRLPTNPRVSFDVRPGLGSTDRDKVGFAASLEALFEVNDAPGARIREAEHRAGSARADAALVRLQARLRAVQLYVAVRLDEQRLVHAQEMVALAERLVTAASERRTAGAGSDIDVTSARMELAERTAELRDAEAERASAEGELRALLAIATPTPLHLTSPIDQPAPAPPLDQLLTRAQAAHPEMSAINERVALLTASDERLRKEAWPKVGLYGGIDASPDSPLFAMLGLSIELPLFARSRGLRAVLSAEKQTELDHLTDVTRRIHQLLRSTHAAYVVRLRELEVLTRDGVPAAETRFHLVQEGWRAGRFDVFRLTTAAQDLARLRAKRIEVLGRLWEERLVLERLTGGWKNDQS